MIVADLMTRSPRTVTPSDILKLAQETMEAGGFRQLPVVDGGQLVGIITDRDLSQHVGQLDHVRVGAAMSAHPFSAQPSMPAEHAAHILVTNKIGSLPVVEGGRLVGIITATDMLHALEAILGRADDGSVRIDLDVAGSGEITAAISLVRTICPVMAIGTYNRDASGTAILYLRVADTGASRAVQALQQYGFKVLAMYQESGLRPADDH
jgi:acetoin utilization protein AcuB